MDDQEFKAELQNLGKLLDVQPLYVLTTTDQFQRLGGKTHQTVNLYSGEGTTAFTSPVADLDHKEAIGYQWRGRGCCLVFCRSPLVMSKPEALGLAIHEMGHWLADCNRPERDDTNERRAMINSQKNLRTEREHHNNRWLRSTLHLWHRACRAGYEIPLNCLGYKQHKITRPAFKRILAETVDREREPIESILATPLSGSKPKRKARATTNGQQAKGCKSDAAPKRRPKVHMQLIGNDILRYRGDAMTLNGKRITWKERMEWQHMMDDERREFRQKLNQRPDFILT